MLVSVEPWSKGSHGGVASEFVAVQLEHFGFTLSRCQAKEYCRKLSQLLAGQKCQILEGDTLFVDLDRTTFGTPLVILASGGGSPHPGWFCDIPEPAAEELRKELMERLRSGDGEMSRADRLKDHRKSCVESTTNP